MLPMNAIAWRNTTRVETLPHMEAYDWLRPKVNANPWQCFSSRPRAKLAYGHLGYGHTRLRAGEDPHLRAGQLQRGRPDLRLLPQEVLQQNNPLLRCLLLNILKASNIIRWCYTKYTIVCRDGFQIFLRNDQNWKVVKLNMQEILWLRRNIPFCHAPIPTILVLYYIT